MHHVPSSFQEQLASSFPRQAERLLCVFLPEADQDPVLGDLVEMFEDNILPCRAPMSARLWYWRQTFGAIAVFAWISLGRWTRRLRPGLGFTGTLARAIAIYYAAVISYCLIQQSPFLFSSLIASGAKIKGLAFVNGLVVFNFKFAHSFWPGRVVFYEYWQAIFYPALSVLVCTFAFCIVRGWLRSFAVCMLLVSSYRLMPFIVGSLALEGGGLVDGRLGPSFILALRIPLALFCLAIVMVGSYSVFRRLAENSGGALGSRVGHFSQAFLLPIGIVSLVRETEFLRQWSLWLLEYRAILLLPAIAIAFLAMLLSTNRAGTVHAH